MIRARTNFRSPLQYTGLVVPETLLPVQLYDSMHQRCTPEKRLVIAILADALNCIQRYYATRCRRGQRASCEAEHWFMSKDRQWPFSFENICDLLSIDSHVVRCAVHSWCEQHGTANADGAAETGVVERLPGH